MSDADWYVVKFIGGPQWGVQRLVQGMPPGVLKFLVVARPRICESNSPGNPEQVRVSVYQRCHDGLTWDGYYPLVDYAYEGGILMSYEAGYGAGYTNGKDSSERGIGVDYIPTADERAACIDFHGDAERRAGWLEGWADAVAPFREFQTRELGVISAADWLRRWH